MKVAVYTIALNEVKHVDRFMECLKGEADSVHVLDTGSTDGTVEALRSHGAHVEVGIVRPWRFDTPRNISLSLVPADVDICVCIDLDEVLSPGWRAAVEAAWAPNTTRLRYPYAWSHNADGSPATLFYYDKIHQRKNYRWVKPVHEVLTIYNEPEVQGWTDSFMLHHWPDVTKSRGSYLPLLELAVKEEPEDDRSSHYLGREYMYYNQHDRAIAELKRHLSLPSARWSSERAASMRFIARCYTQLGNLEEAESWALKACIEAKSDREPWYDLAKVAYSKQDFNTLYFATTRALSSGERGKTYISDPEAWGYLLYDYAALASFYTGRKDEALKHGEAALAKANELLEGKHVIDRLTANLAFYK